MTAAMPIVIPITVNMLRILFLSRATKGTGFLYIRDEVSDRIWNTLAGKVGTTLSYALSASSNSGRRVSRVYGAFGQRSSLPIK